MGGLEDIVSITQYYNNEDRLRWDLLNIPHHCSYLALSDEKGDNETEPIAISELVVFVVYRDFRVKKPKPKDIIFFIEVLPT